MNPQLGILSDTGGAMAGLIPLVVRRLRPQGVLVMKRVTLENLDRAIAVLESQRTAWDCTQLQTVRGRPLLGMHRLAAENPVWVLCARVSDAIGAARGD